MHRYAVNHLKHKNVMKNPNEQPNINSSVHRLIGYAGSEIVNMIRQGRHREAEAIALLIDNLGHNAAHQSPWGAKEVQSSVKELIDLYHHHFPVAPDRLDFGSLWRELLESSNGDSPQ